MTPILRPLFYYLWIAPHVLQVIVLTLLIKRGLYRKFPVFTAYIAFSIGKFIALLFISHSSIRASYFQWYSFGLSICIALFFGIVWEVFSGVFENQSVLRNVRKPLFRWATIGFLAVAFSFAVYTHRLDTDVMWFSVHVLERSANIVLCGLIVTIFWFSYYLGLSWSRAAFGIALGVGVLCSFELAFSALRSRIGLYGHEAIDLIDLGIYHSCVVVWLFYLLTPERKPPSIPVNVPDNDLESWNHEIESLLTR